MGQQILISNLNLINNRRLNMGSVTYNGSISKDDPRYKEGFKIIGFNNNSKCDDSEEDQKLIEYLPESSREHDVIGKWLSLANERENGNLPTDNNCFNNVSFGISSASK